MTMRTQYVRAAKVLATCLAALGSGSLGLLWLGLLILSTPHLCPLCLNSATVVADWTLGLPRTAGSTSPPPVQL